MTRQRCSDTWHKAERRWFTGELIGSSRRVEGKYGGVTGVESSSPAAKIHPPRDVIRLPRARILTPATRITAEGRSSTVNRSEPERLLYHGLLQSVSLTVPIQARFSLKFKWQLN